MALGLAVGSPAIRARGWPFVFPGIQEAAAGLTGGARWARRGRSVARDRWHEL